jgi:hypothetical protein
MDKITALFCILNFVVSIAEHNLSGTLGWFVAFLAYVRLGYKKELNNGD